MESIKGITSVAQVASRWAVYHLEDSDEYVFERIVYVASCELYDPEDRERRWQLVEFIVGEIGVEPAGEAPNYVGSIHWTLKPEDTPEIREILSQLGLRA